jgi:catechol 2,3-dioxygenase-like lactoylglutathione lyase family enzyme
MTVITRVGTVLIPVSDQDRALEFYVGTLGFEVLVDGPFGDGGRWIEVAPPGAATSIALVPQPAHVHLPRPGRQPLQDGRAGLKRR